MKSEVTVHEHDVYLANCCSCLLYTSNPTELTAELLNTLIEKIVIHEATTVDGMREQNIDIYYRFIGKIE